MTERRARLFVVLIGIQAAHSFEECWFHLYDVFPPAALVARLISTDLAWGFAVANLVLLNLAAWTYFERVRADHPSATAWLWGWTALEVANGVSHLSFAVLRGGYAPGVITAPLLLTIGFTLGLDLVRHRPAPTVHS